MPPWYPGADQRRPRRSARSWASFGDLSVYTRSTPCQDRPTTFLVDWTLRGRCRDTAGDPVGDRVDLSYSTTGAYTLDGDELMLDDPGAYGTWTGTAGGSELTLTTGNGTVTVWTLQG